MSNIQPKANEKDNAIVPAPVDVDASAGNVAGPVVADNVARSTDTKAGDLNALSGTSVAPSLAGAPRPSLAGAEHVEVDDTSDILADLSRKLANISLDSRSDSSIEDASQSILIDEVNENAGIPEAEGAACIPDGCDKPAEPCMENVDDPDMKLSAKKTGQTEDDSEKFKCTPVNLFTMTAPELLEALGSIVSAMKLFDFSTNVLPPKLMPKREPSGSLSTEVDLYRPVNLKTSAFSGKSSKEQVDDEKKSDVSEAATYENVGDEKKSGVSEAATYENMDDEKKSGVSEAATYENVGDEKKSGVSEAACYENVNKEKEVNGEDEDEIKITGEKGDTKGDGGDEESKDEGGNDY